MDKSIVSIVKGTDPAKMVEEATSLLGGIGTLIRPNSTVVANPNTVTINRLRPAWIPVRPMLLLP